MAKYLGPTPGLGSVGQYQMSGKPWATASFAVPGAGAAPLEISFPTVTSWLWIKNLDSNIPVRLGFSALGTTGTLGVAGGTNHFVYIAPEAEASTFQIRCRSIFLLSDTVSENTSVCIMAGLTAINNNLVDTAGPNYSGSVGVG